MSEPLIGKQKTVDTKYYEPIPRGQTIVEVFLKENVKSAVDFYKDHYYGSPDELPIEHFKEYKKWLNGKMNKQQVKNYLRDFPIAQDWLINYCFGDVIE